MFGLIYGLWKHYFSKPQYQILILGLHSSGKTAILEQIRQIYLNTPPFPLDKLIPTVGLNVAKVETKSSLLVFWDLGGQVSLRGIWEKYYDQCHALIFVIDSNDQIHLEEAKQTFDSLIAHPDLNGIPCLLLFSKQDLHQLSSPAELGDKFLRGINNRRIRYETVSIKNQDTNKLKSGIQWLNDIIRESGRNIKT